MSGVGPGRSVRPAGPAGRPDVPPIPPPAAAPRAGAELSVAQAQDQWPAPVGLEEPVPSPLGQFPAWFVSLVIHLVGLLLLSLWVVHGDRSRPSITLATTLGSADAEGSLEELDALEFEALEPFTPDPPASWASIDGLELAMDSTAPAFDALGDLGELGNLAPSDLLVGSSTMFAGRTAGMRAELVRREGGTELTEAAVARGLVWLARHQNTDGSWSFHGWHVAPRAARIPDGVGSVRNDVAATALALLPFLGAGQTHRQGQYQDTVHRGLEWLLSQQRPNGDLRGNWHSRGRDISRMYAHAQAAIVLCEALALTGDYRLREPAQRSLDFIVKAQHSRGGWRYKPKEAGDTSVFGWQIMALRSGKMCYLRVPQETFEKASRYLDAVQTDRYGGKYAYQPKRPATPSMSAEALLCRQYLGWPREHSGLLAGVQYLLKNLPNKSSPNIYYWYYATQVLHHYGGEPWKRWNTRMRTVLVEMQRRHGPLAGSWDPLGRHADMGGRIYMTSLALCTLEVYYRHMPLYRQSAVEVELDR